MAHPTSVLSVLSGPVRAHLARGFSGERGSGQEVAYVVATLRQAVDGLVQDERLSAEVDLNLSSDHGFATLTDRQESLARAQKCAAKTVRRRANRAMETLAYVLLTGHHSRISLPTPQNGSATTPAGGRELSSAQGEADLGASPLRRFWGLEDGARVDIVCSEIPAEERPEYAVPTDRNYLRYAKFADLDSLIYLRTRFAQLTSAVTVRDFAPSEYYDTQADVLVVVGGPPWNAKFREFLPQLPFHFESHPLGQDDPLVVPQLGLTLGPRWTERQELLEDLVVFTRLSLAQGTMVFLLGGCLTLGVLGAAHCFLEGDRGARSVRYLGDRVGQDDFVLVTEARRVGGFTDVADLSVISPLLLLSRQNNGPFTVVVDNTRRYTVGR